jgi:hypothetical protein
MAMGVCKLVRQIVTDNAQVFTEAQFTVLRREENG